MTGGPVPASSKTSSTGTNSSDFKYASASMLLQRLCQQEKGNFVFSPLSLGTCLAMAAVGLRGESKAQLMDFIKAPDEDTLHSAFAGLIADNEKPLQIANKMIASHNYEVLEQAVSFLMKNYQSEIECADFANNGREVERRVNAWVSEKTKSKIPQLLSEGILVADTVLVLVNAIYFKGAWQDEFDRLNDKRDFRLRGGEVVKRDFMKKTSGAFVYKETDRLRLVRIPYRESRFYMLVAIPKRAEDNIDEVIAETQPCEIASTLNNILDGRVICKVILTMPMFKMEYDVTGLPEHLKQLGVTKMFQPGECDLGNLFAQGNRPPYISKVIHKAIIEVNEKGTEAAAATAVVGMAGCAPIFKPPPEIEVTIDRPFCFWIISDDYMVSFAGVCADP